MFLSGIRDYGLYSSGRKLIIHSYFSDDLKVDVLQ